MESCPQPHRQQGKDQKRQQQCLDQQPPGGGMEDQREGAQRGGQDHRVLILPVARPVNRTLLHGDTRADRDGTRTFPVP